MITCDTNQYQILLVNIGERDRPGSRWMDGAIESIEFIAFIDKESGHGMSVHSFAAKIGSIKSNMCTRDGELV